MRSPALIKVRRRVAIVTPGTLRFLRCTAKPVRAHTGTVAVVDRFAGDALTQVLARAYCTDAAHVVVCGRVTVFTRLPDTDDSCGTDAVIAERLRVTLRCRRPYGQANAGLAHATASLTAAVVAHDAVWPDRVRALAGLE